MTPIKTLVEGLKLLEPFLSTYGFTVENYNNGVGSGGQFTIATFSNGDKKFVLGYRYSIGELYYQYGDLKVGHDFYLRQLGHGDKMKFPDFQSADSLKTFRNVLHDFELIRNDFFEGDCKELKRIERLQREYIGNIRKQSEVNVRNEKDLKRIKEARRRFKVKDYNGSLDIYGTVNHQDLLSEFDLKTIDYCKQKVG